MKIIIIDYGMGNLGSILNMLKYIGVQTQISGSPEVICSADKLILPGVGAFDNGISKLKESGIYEVINKKVLIDKTPVLGICLGMQMMTSSSEEGVLPGLNWIDAKTIRFKQNGEKNFKIPHMGWNNVYTYKYDRIIEGLTDLTKFYFVHSYYVSCNNDLNSVCKTNYGVTFDSIIVKDNIYGCQFHPEKSHKFGMKFLNNFANL